MKCGLFSVALCSLFWFLQIRAGAVEQNLLQWLQDNGGSYKGISISEFEGMGRGIIATKHVKEGDEILKIPGCYV